MHTHNVITISRLHVVMCNYLKLFILFIFIIIVLFLALSSSCRLIEMSFLFLFVHLDILERLAVTGRLSTEGSSTSRSCTVFAVQRAENALHLIL